MTINIKKPALSLVLSFSQQTKKKSHSKSMLFWLVVSSILYLFIQFEDIAFLLKESDGNISITDGKNPPPNNSNSKPTPIALPNDLVLQPDRWPSPIVIHEYKLLFYPIPKVACTEWKLLFRHMEGQPEWNTTSLKVKSLHDPNINNLTTLNRIPFKEAQHILTSSQWTRAVFLREPKERILSAFLDKYVNNPSFFIQKCCVFGSKHDNVSKDACIKRMEDQKFSHFLNMTGSCPNDHWNPQYSMIDAKWWDTISFVGYLDSVYDDAKRLLQSLISVEDGLSAWEKHGMNGWGRNGTNSFMERDTAHHATNAHDKLRSYYTREDEQFVENHWSGEWTHTLYHFDSFKLFNNSTPSV